MQGERVEQITLDPGGVEGDRAVALLDVETNTVASAHHPGKWGLLLRCQARWEGEPSDGEIVVTMPDGTDHTVGPMLEAELSRLLGRRVTFVRENPEGGSYEIVHPEVDAAPEGFLQRTLELAGVRDGRIGKLGLGLDAPRGALVDVAPIHLISTGSLQAFAAAGGDPDLRRFRPNVVLETTGQDFEEQALMEQRIGLGDVSVRTTIPTPRCIVPTSEQAGVTKDLAVLKTLAAHNKITIGGGAWACLGLYGHPECKGTVRV
jgi:uncharacterized protein YcbX